jgi:tricorn protease
MKSFALGVAALAATSVLAQTPGYYRQPAIHGDTIVFVAEGDLWRVSTSGGDAQRLTTHPGPESFPAISPDGRWLAFSARYEGPMEVYVMSMAGGPPTRLTYDGGANARVQGFTPDGKVLHSTTRLSGKPSSTMYAIDINTKARTQLPLAQVAEGCYHGNVLTFTRLARPSDNVRNYRGGLVQTLWRFDGNSEATPLSQSYAGTSRMPMCTSNGRVAFLSDRSGVMNVWSMRADGSDMKQHTDHRHWDVQHARAHGNVIVYQHGADVRVVNLTTNQDRVIPIRLVSDFDQLRTRWIKTPMERVTHLSLSPTGDRVALTTRGQVHVLPTGPGRRVDLAKRSDVRLLNTAFSRDGKSLYVVSDETGDLEVFQYAANALSPGKPLTREPVPNRRTLSVSPDGKWIANTARDNVLRLIDTASGTTRTIKTPSAFDIESVTWSPDNHWLALVLDATNAQSQIVLLEIASGQFTPVTSDRYDSRSPAFSPDGQFLYFLSDRNFQSIVRGPWGPRNPSPFFDRLSKVYAVALQPEAKWPYAVRNELSPPVPRPAPPPAAPADAGAAASAPKVAAISIANIAERLYEVPLPAGNYSQLATDGRRLYYISADTAYVRKNTLRTLPIEPTGLVPPTSEVFFDDVRSYELSGDLKKLLVRRNNDLFVFDAGAKAPTDITKSAVNTRDWVLQVDPRTEWTQMFHDAWRMHRDDFWDPRMNGADWLAVRKKYEALLPRVTERGELDDLLAQMVAELSTLHSQIVPGDDRKGTDDIDAATLGAQLRFTPEGYVVEQLFNGDPELIEERSPLARTEVNVRVGDRITHANGVILNTVHALEKELRGQANKQVLLSTLSADGKTRDVIVTPVTAQRDFQLRYLHWERERLERTEQATNRRVGYIHLQAMREPDMARFVREFYPAVNREGLILDLRSNTGGNIDSWVIERLQRRAWHFWKSRQSETTYPNQQLAFRGHIVALVDSNTYSDGETISEGLKRLGIAKLIGTRTAGAGIWLSDQNTLRDGGRMRAAETGVFVDTPNENRWIIEGEGVTPDIEVDNLPHATFRGEDAQLEAAIKYLTEKIASQPVRPPRVPGPPNKVKP